MNLRHLAMTTFVPLQAMWSVEKSHESSRIFRTSVRHASSGLTSGIAKGGQPFAWGAGLCPASLFPCVAGGDVRKRGFCGDTPHPSRDAALPAPSLSRIFVSKIRDDSWLNPSHVIVHRRESQESYYLFSAQQALDVLAHACSETSLLKALHLNERVSTPALEGEMDPEQAPDQCVILEESHLVGILYPSLRVKQKEERRDQKEPEEYLHVVK